MIDAFTHHTSLDMLLAEIRARDIKVDDLAELSGLTRQTVYNILSRKHEPTMRSFKKLSDGVVAYLQDLPK